MMTRDEADRRDLGCMVGMTIAFWPCALFWVVIGLAALELAGCAGLTGYSPGFSESARANPNYAGDLAACQSQVRAEQNSNEMFAAALIPIYGMVKTFDTSDPSTYYGRARAVTDCMTARGYR